MSWSKTSARLRFLDPSDEASLASTASCLAVVEFEESSGAWSAELTFKQRRGDSVIIADVEFLSPDAPSRGGARFRLLVNGKVAAVGKLVGDPALRDAARRALVTAHEPRFTVGSGGVEHYAVRSSVGGRTCTLVVRFEGADVASRRLVVEDFHWGLPDAATVEADLHLQRGRA